ncbi:MAG: helix-turn-helix domain-containing protein [Vallitalea sp.]|nr:helix-turn-helix domain-containing protein [Vallitalea sp.]
MTDIRYIISDASKKLDVEPHVLRYWEEELELEIPRNEMGHRYFREEDIIMLRNVKKLKDQGLQLKAIKMLLPDMLEEDKLLTETTDIVPTEEIERSSEDELTVSIPDSGKNKVEQFQEFMKAILLDTLKENNEKLKIAVTKEVSSEVRLLFEEREEIEERRYKKLDETIREMQKMRQQIAASSNKKKKRFKFKK